MDKLSLIESHLFIDDKRRRIVPFVLNPIQRHFLENKRQRNIILKSRQVGVTSCLLADMFIEAITVPNTTCVLVSHSGYAAERLLARVQFFYDNFPEPKPMIDHFSSYEVTFPLMHSIIYIRTAQSMGSIRGERVDKALLSEISRYEKGSDILNAMEEAVPLDTGELTLECYDKETEVLTEHGWMLFKDLVPDTKVLTKNRLTGEAYYTTPLEHFSGKADSLIHYKHKAFDLAVTHNHSMWAKKKGWTWISKGIKQITVHGFGFHRADSLNTDFTLDSSLVWNGKEQECFVLPAYHYEQREHTQGSRNVYNPEVKIPMDLWMEFMGYFLSEGWVDGTNSVSIYQDGIHTDRMREVAEEVALCLGRTAGIYNSGRHFSIGSKQLALYLFNYTKPKRIPRELLMLSPRQLNILLEAYLKGDGYMRGNDKECSTIDATLRDDLQELGLKIGYRPTWHIRPAGQDSRGVNRAASHIIHFSRKLYPTVRKSRQQIAEIPYNDIVYCVTLPEDNLLMVRRNGKPCWSGNSTPFGEDNIFYEEWVKAREKRSGYKPFFFPWWMDSGYKIPKGSDLALEADRGNFTLEKDEKELTKIHKLTREQLRWRRRKIADKGALFFQEYPESEVDCWKISGEPVFDPNILSEKAQLCHDGKRYPEGFFVWIEPDSRQSYVIGADCSAGAETGTYSAAAVVDDNYNVCATFQARLDPARFADILRVMGKLYNNAKIAVERNAQGYAVLSNLSSYPNLYYQRDYTTGKQTEKLGWWTSEQTRNFLITTFRQMLSRVNVWDINVIRQARSYTYLKYKPTTKGFDDLLMSLMIAVAVKQVHGTSRGYVGSARKWQ